MLTIILTKGLPASGKSTWSRGMLDQYPGKYKRVNKDELRVMLDNSRWSKSNEKFVINLRDYIIKEAIKEGKHVIVDDTNLHPKHELRMLEIIKELKDQFFEVKLEIKDFTDVPLDLCIERDLKRTNSVGEKVIRQMYSDFISKDEVNFRKNRDPNLPNCIIIDIDGTLSIKGKRSPYDYTKVGQDLLNDDIADIVKTYNKDENIKVFIFSGRDECCRLNTEEWLKNNNITYNHLVMRGNNDFRKDFIVKREMYDEYISGKYNVKFVIDDRNQVVDMWRKELGLTCLQCNYGDF